MPLYLALAGRDGQFSIWPGCFGDSDKMFVVNLLWRIHEKANLGNNFKNMVKI